MEIVKDVPLWAVRRICKPGGEHHRKQTTPWQFQGWARRTPRHHGADNRLPLHYRHAAAPTEYVVPAGNLTEGDYRFYKGATDVHAGYRKCRWCSKLFFNAKDAEAHKEAADNHCFTYLRIVFSMLLAQRPMQCSVCGVITDHQRWGLPICKGKCVYSWKFDAFGSAFWDSMVEKARLKGLLMEAPANAAH